MRRVSVSWRLRKGRISRDGYGKYYHINYMYLYIKMTIINSLTTLDITGFKMKTEEIKMP